MDDPHANRGVPAPFFCAVTALAFGPDWGLHAGGVNLDLPSRNARPALARLDPFVGIRFWTTTVGGSADLTTVTALTSAGNGYTSLAISRPRWWGSRRRARTHS